MKKLDGKNTLTVLPMQEQDIPFQHELMNNPDIMSAIHIDKTDIALWQEAFLNFKTDDDEENFIIQKDGVQCAWIRINGLDSDMPWISMLAVCPKNQGQGIGRYAINFAENFVKSKGFYRLGIHTTEDNVIAQTLYNKKCNYITTEFGDCATADGEHRKGYTFIKILSLDITYKKLSQSDLKEDLLNDFNRYQEVTRYYTKQENGLVVQDCNFTEHWDNDKKNSVIQNDFTEAIKYGGEIYGAYDNKKLIGFSCYDGRFIGEQGYYLQLVDLHVSSEYRNKGIGRTLFNLCADGAKSKGAKKLYISASSCYDSQQFYRKTGCVEATHIVKHLCEKEPFDIQMEYLI